MISMLKKLLTKFHIYLCLFSLVDLWLFCLTGLFLSHPEWSVNDYTTESRWIATTASVTPAQGGDPLANAEHYLAQLDLTGEVSTIAMDGLAVGLIVLILTGWYMWLQTKRIVGGAVSLLLGTGLALLFLFL